MRAGRNKTLRTYSLAFRSNPGSGLCTTLTVPGSARPIVPAGHAAVSSPRQYRVHPRFSGEFFNRHWASLMQGLVKTEGVAHSDQCDAYRTPEIVQHLPYELMQLCFINHVLLPLLSLCPCGFSQPQRKPVSPRTPSADLPTTSCTVIEFAG